MSSQGSSTELSTHSYKTVPTPQVGVQPGSLEIVPGIEGLLGATVCFSNGTSWKLTKALTPPAYAEGDSPFEGRQVFECLCVRDPNALFVEQEEAIIKVKYQVRGTDKALGFLDEKLDLVHELWGDKPEWEQKFTKQLAYVKNLVHMATTPTETLNDATVYEIIALDHFRQTNSVHTPRLIDTMITQLPPNVDEQGMTGGYAAFIVMNKVPGRRLKLEEFWDMNMEQRNELRQAFKEALLDVWRLGIYPNDCAMRNIVWDEAETKCYIVDFEDYDEIKIENVEIYWDELEPYQSWWLDEERCPNHLEEACSARTVTYQADGGWPSILDSAEPSLDVHWSPHEGSFASCSYGANMEA